MKLSRTMPLWMQAAMPVGLVLFAALVRSEAVPVLRYAPYITFFPAITISALYGGLWPGLFAIALSIVAVSDWFRLAVLAPFNIPGGIEGMIIFLGSSVIVVLICAQRKQAEEQMSMLSALVQSAEDAIISKDLEGVVKSWNIGAEKIFGYAGHEALGRNISFLIPEGSFNEVPEISRRIAQGEHIGYYETVRLRKDGKIIPVSLTFSPIRDAGGRVIGISSIAHDISERKRLISELERSNKELEQFAYVASHDLQEPLRMVSSYVKLLERRYKEKLDAQADTYIGFAADGAIRMQKLIEGLLAYSRISRRGTEFGQVDINEVFARAVSNLSSAVRESEAVVTKDELPVVSGDETQLLQLLQNLIGNAIKFRRPEIPPEVHIAAKRTGAEWIFSVSDNGIGIEPQYFERIFLMFQRLHTRAQYEGTGIGLALCKRIVERHNGRIWVKSVPGKGTIFLFTIGTGGQNEHGSM